MVVLHWVTWLKGILVVTNLEVVCYVFRLIASLIACSSTSLLTYGQNFSCVIIFSADFKLTFSIFKRQRIAKIDGRMRSNASWMKTILLTLAIKAKALTSFFQIIWWRSLSVSNAFTKRSYGMKFVIGMFLYWIPSFAYRSCSCSQSMLLILISFCVWRFRT